MAKIAFFVEGQTEQLFVERLVKEVAGAKDVLVRTIPLRGKPRAIRLEGTVGTATYNILICDCGADNTVASDVRDNYDNLVSDGYSSIVAIRDVRPIPASQIARLYKGLGYGIKTKPVVVCFVLAIMEIEAWFLAEHSHFQKVSPLLTPSLVQATLGCDPQKDDLTQLAQPANDLDRVYRAVDLAYTKRKANVERTLKAMDYATIYLELSSRISGLGRLVASIDEFLS